MEAIVPLEWPPDAEQNLLSLSFIIPRSPLSSVVAVEVDNEFGALTLLLSAPPATYLGHQAAAQPVRRVGGLSSRLCFDL